MRLRKKSFIIVYIGTILLSSILSCNNTRGQNHNSDDPAIRMLKDFYTCYISERSKWPFNVEVIDSIKNKYCTPKLISNIHKLFEEQKIESDPFIKSQIADTNMLRTIKFRHDTKRNDIYYVSYNWPYDKTEQITIKLIVLKVKDYYKIDYVFIND